METKTKELKMKKGKPLHSRAVVAVWKRIMWRKEKEAVARLASDPDKFVRTLFFNPVIAAQSSEGLVLEPHYYLGHAFPRGREFLGKDGFVSMEQAIEEITQVMRLRTRGSGR
jgi:hypothetical protein